MYTLFMNVLLDRESLGPTRQEHISSSWSAGGQPQGIAGGEVDQFEEGQPRLRLDGREHRAHYFDNDGPLRRTHRVRGRLRSISKPWRMAW
jgi:hypothetical protein